MYRFIKYNYILIGSFISSVWTSDPIVPALTAGVLDRKAGLYVVNTLILSSASPAHVRSRPESYLTWKIPMSSSLRKGVDFRRDRDFSLVRLTPIKGNLLTLLLSSVSDRQ